MKIAGHMKTTEHCVFTCVSRRECVDRGINETTMSAPDDRECRQPQGTFVPVVDRARCEGKRDCVTACPYNVFEVRTIDDADFRQLSFLDRLKSRAHGKRTAYTQRAADCRACGKCVEACPEKAIKLARTGS
jgi:NAD-dependent dihydropyrimidine dehydrogenase PreA subunit